MDNLPFIYMELEAVMAAGPFKSKSTLYAKIKAGEFVEPDRINGRSLWRSDRIAQYLTAQAAKADAEREERSKQAQAKAQRLVAARREARPHTQARKDGRS